MKRHISGDFFSTEMFVHWERKRLKGDKAQLKKKKKNPKTLDVPLEVGEDNMFSFVIWLNQHFKWSQRLCGAFFY